MNMAHSSAQGWYPDESTGGTRFWDGRQWTSDTRPPRKAFAAESSHRGAGLTLMVIGVLCVLSSPAQFGQTSVETTTPPIVAFLFSIVLGIGLAAWGVYLFRGDGIATKTVLARLEAERVSQAVRATMPAPPQAAAQTIQINVAAPVAQTGGVEEAQIKALSNPETAKAIQNLQNLLYTRAITDEEYEAAKRKLLG